MEQGFDKEIDSLLRRGRGGAGARVETGGNGGGVSPAHLDADELSAYAEGALPSAARLAAASHLADCADCRGAVVGLVRAAGVEAALEKSPVAETPASRETKPRVSWRDRLGTLFAPRVLRFVAPVLAVCLLGALAFVALRSRQSAPELTQDVQRQNTSPRVGITAPEESHKAAQPVGADTAPGQSPSVNTNTATREAASAPVTQGTTATTAGPADGRAADAAPSEAPAPPPPAAASEVTASELTALPVQSRAGGAGTGAPPPPAPKTVSANEDRDAKAGAPAGQLREEVTVTGNAQQQNRAANNQPGNFDYSQSPDGSRAQRRAPPNAPRRPRPTRPSAPKSARIQTRRRSGRRAGAGALSRGSAGRTRASERVRRPTSATWAAAASAAKAARGSMSTTSLPCPRRASAAAPTPSAPSSQTTPRSSAPPNS